MNPNLKISIITVCLNADKTIEKSINSVISQNYKFKEYIIVDGGSIDKTLSIIEKYKNQISYFISEKDNGIYDAMNKGINKATGDFIYFLGADDILTDNILSQIIPKLKSNVNAIHYGKVRLQPEGKLLGGKFNKWKLIHKNISPQAIFYPSIVFKTKRFNMNYPIAADWDFNLYLMSKKIRFKYNGLIIAVFNINGISSKGDREFYRNRKMIIKDYFGKKELIFFITGIQLPILILNFIITKYKKIFFS